MTDNTLDNTTEQNQVEVKELIIGDFKPKRKFLNFVSAINGKRIRILSDIAFIKGEKLSGLGLDNVIFKVTICDEGTIKFEEVDTNVTDYAYRKRLIDDITSMDVTGYAQKFVVNDLEFADKNGGRCYLEVEEKKPIDKLKSLFDEMDNTKEISEKGLSFLDELLSNKEEESVANILFSSETDEELKREFEGESTTVEEKSAKTMMEESFKRMNDDKINELKDRLEDKESEIRKAKVEISHAEAKIKSSSDELKVLNTRLESLSPGDEANGYVFFVTEEQKNETGVDDSTKEIADKIADLMNLKKDVLFKYLTGGFYKIKIGKKGENDKKLDSMDSDILEKIHSIDPIGKITMTDSNEFEYRGELNWHQLTGKMIRKGFEQDPEFNKISGSNSYESKEEVKEHVCDDGCSHQEVDKYKSAIEGMVKELGLGEGVKFGEDGIEIIETKKDEFKTKLLKTIDTPQDIVIIGTTALFHGVLESRPFSFSITDDYTGFDINIGGKKSFSVESDGFVTILGIQEFLEMKKKMEEDDDFEIGESAGLVILKNFSGEIRLGVMDDNGKSDYEFDTNSYIQHQIDSFDGSYLNVILDLPVGSNAIEVNSEDDLTSILRDGKISTILDENKK